MALEQLTPAGVAQLDRPGGGVDDVSEQHRSEDSVGAMSRSGAREELLHLVDDDVDVADREPVVGTGYGEKARALDVVCDIPTLLNGDDRVVHPVNDERRHLDRREDVPNVELEEHAHDSRCRRGACLEGKEGPPCLHYGGGPHT